MLKQRLSEVKSSAPKVTFCQDPGTWAGGLRWGEMETPGWVRGTRKRAVSRWALIEKPADCRVTVHFKFIIVFASKCLLIFQG